MPRCEVSCRLTPFLIPLLAYVSSSLGEIRQRPLRGPKAAACSAVRAVFPSVQFVFAFFFTHKGGARLQSLPQLSMCYFLGITLSLHFKIKSRTGRNWPYLLDMLRSDLFTHALNAPCRSLHFANSITNKIHMRASRTIQILFDQRQNHTNQLTIRVTRVG